MNLKQFQEQWEEDVARAVSVGELTVTNVRIVWWHRPAWRARVDWKVDLSKLREFSEDPDIEVRRTVRHRFFRNRRRCEELFPGWEPPRV